MTPSPPGVPDFISWHAQYQSQEPAISLFPHACTVIVYASLTSTGPSFGVISTWFRVIVAGAAAAQYPNVRKIIVFRKNAPFQKGFSRYAKHLLVEIQLEKCLVFKGGANNSLRWTTRVVKEARSPVWRQRDRVARAPRGPVSDSGSHYHLNLKQCIPKCQILGWKESASSLRHFRTKHRYT